LKEFDYQENRPGRKKTISNYRLKRYFFFFAFRGGGTFPPSRRACERPIAIACFRLFTRLPERPLLSSPVFLSCNARLTFCCAILPYRAMIHCLHVWLPALPERSDEIRNYSFSKRRAANIKALTHAARGDSAQGLLDSDPLYWLSCVARSGKGLRKLSASHAFDLGALALLATAV
jgi:hypothetical protein